MVICDITFRETHPVQSQLKQLTQQMMYVVLICTEGKEVIEDELISIRSGHKILQGQICTEKARLEREVSGVGGQVMIQQAIIDEVRKGISILQGQDNIIVLEPREIFQRIRHQIADMVKKLATNGSTLINHKKVIVKLQDNFKIWKEVQQSLENKVEDIEKHMKMVPSNDYITKHMKSMDEALFKIQDVSTGLTTHMEAYKVSESTLHEPRSIQLGPSYGQPMASYVQPGPSYTHPSQNHGTRISVSYESAQDMQEEATRR